LYARHICPSGAYFDALFESHTWKISGFDLSAASSAVHATEGNCGDVAVQSGVHCPMKHIKGFTINHCMLPLGKCLCRIAPVAAMGAILVEKQNTNKNYF
jgi:hypothetical protein